MIVSASLAVFLGVVLVVLYRGGRLRLRPSVTVGAFGFALASTGAAPTITNVIHSLVGLIGSIGA